MTEGFVTEFTHLATTDVRSYGVDNLVLASSGGNMACLSEVTEMTGDVMINSNLIVNNSVHFQDMNVFRNFGTYEISYGMRITDDERLELFKFDSRQGKSTRVNMFGMGAVSTGNSSITEEITAGLSAVYNKGARVSQPVRGKPTA
jgi:hypothetical protein